MPNISNFSLKYRAALHYPSKAREDWLKEKGYRNRIQRKGQRNNPLSACQVQRNKRIAKRRARVAHVFGAIEQMGESGSEPLVNRVRTLR